MKWDFLTLHNLQHSHQTLDNDSFKLLTWDFQQCLWGSELFACHYFPNRRLSSLYYIVWATTSHGSLIIITSNTIGLQPQSAWNVLWPTFTLHYCFLLRIHGVPSYHWRRSSTEMPHLWLYDPRLFSLSWCPATHAQFADLALLSMKHWRVLVR